MSNPLKVGPYLRWPLAIGSIALVALAAWLVPSVLASLNRVEIGPAWYYLPFPIAAIGLTFWHRSNLNKYRTVTADWSYTAAHIGGTAVASVLILVLAGSILIGALWLMATVLPPQAGQFVLVVATPLAMFPFLYYTGRFTADVLDGQWWGGEIAETDSSSPYHPQNAFRTHSPSAYYTVKEDHWVSYCITAVPCVILFVSGLVVFEHMRLPSPAAARCMAAAEESRWMVQDTPNPSDIAAAIRCYDEAIRLDPNFALTHLWRGHAHKRMRQYDLAKTDYETAARLNSEYRDVLSSFLAETSANDVVPHIPESDK